MLEEDFNVTEAFLVLGISLDALTGYMWADLEEDWPEFAEDAFFLVLSKGALPILSCRSPADECSLAEPALFTEGEDLGVTLH